MAHEPFIIEHPTRGTLKFFVSADEYGFSTTGSRNDPDKTQQFHSLQDALRVFSKLPAKVKSKCQVMRYDRETFSYLVEYPTTQAKQEEEDYSNLADEASCEDAQPWNDDDWDSRAVENAKRYAARNQLPWPPGPSDFDHWWERVGQHQR